MPNYAAIIGPLSISGSRLSDGTANASGLVWFFQPGTNTPVNVYADAAASSIVTQPITLGQDGKLPSQYPGGVFATQPIRLLIQNASGTTVTDNVWIPATAGNVGVNNAGWTASNLDAILTALFTSTGGQDGKYLVANGQTPLNINSVITGISVSVKAFGAKGDGIAVDTSAAQTALNFASAAGGGVVYFPPGTYKIDQALTLTSATGVTIRGAGQSASKIVTTHGSANVFTFTSCTGYTVQDIGISASATNSGSALGLTSCASITLRNVLVDASGGGTFLIPVSMASCTTVRLDGCDLTPKSADATARTIKMTDTSEGLITGGAVRANAGAAVEFAGSSSKVSILGTSFTPGGSGNPTGVLWSATSTGTDFAVIGCATLRTGLGLYSKAFDMSAISTDPRLRQYANGDDGPSSDTTVLSGGTVTPDRGYGIDFRYRGTTTGAAYIVNAPTPTPVAGTSGQRDTLIRLILHNNAAGAVTGWNLNAVYHTTGAISTTDGNITAVTFDWDPISSVWREIARAVTT